MNRGDLCAILHHQTGLPKGKTLEVIKTIFDSIKVALWQGEPVHIVGFGKFGKTYVKASEKRRALRKRHGYPKRNTILYTFMPAESWRYRELRGHVDPQRVH